MINRLSIKNFRSIKNLEIEPNKLTALIGPNGSGKTNILKAINLVLGEGWTTKAKVARNLFNDSNQDVEVEIGFIKPIIVPGNPGFNDTEVESIKLVMSLQPEFSAKTTINGGQKFWGQESFKKLCHFIYFPSERNLISELRVSEWTMLGKMMRLIYENYVTKYDNNPEKLVAAFKEKMTPARDFLENDFSESSITFKKFADTFVKKCHINSSGMATGFKPDLRIYNLNWFYKTLQIHVLEDDPNKYYDGEDVGAGMQNLLMLSIFQTYAELMGGKVIFGVEEPEIYLYPQAQRALYKSFIDLSKVTQIFYTTHNPNFVEASQPDNIFSLRRSLDKGSYVLEKSSYFTSENAEKPENKYRIYTQFNPERNELFFAKRIVLVEGSSEKILFSTLCSEYGIDIDALGISIIACGGKGGVNYFVGVCKLVGLDDYFAVWDQDAQGEQYKPKVDHLPEALSLEKGVEIPGDLEQYLGLPVAENADKVKNAHLWALQIEERSLPGKLATVLQFIKAGIAVEAVSENTQDVTQTNDDAEVGIEDLPF